MSGLILPGGSTAGDGGRDQDDERSGGGGRRINVTNFLSLGHLTPWGGLLNIRRVPHQEIKDRFKDKRIDMFVIPDLDLMGELLRHEIEVTGHMPQGTQQEREESFCGTIEQAVHQMTGCRVKRLKEPRAVTAERSTFYVQFYVQPEVVAGAGMTLGNIWWELIPKELYQKPGSGNTISGGAAASGGASTIQGTASKKDSS